MLFFILSLLSEINKCKVNKKVLLRECKRHTARKRAQDADPPPLADPPPRLDLTPPGSWTWPPRQLDLTPPHRQLDLTPPPSSWTWTPPGSWTWPPPAAGPDPPAAGPDPPPAGLTPPQVWTKWKHYLPHPSDAGGNYGKSWLNLSRGASVFFEMCGNYLKVSLNFHLNVRELKENLSTEIFLDGNPDPLTLKVVTFTVSKNWTQFTRGFTFR